LNKIYDNWGFETHNKIISIFELDKAEYPRRAPTYEYYWNNDVYNDPELLDGFSSVESVQWTFNDVERRSALLSTRRQEPSPLFTVSAVGKRSFQVCDGLSLGNDDGPEGTRLACGFSTRDDGLRFRVGACAWADEMDIPNVQLFDTVGRFITEYAHQLAFAIIKNDGHKNNPFSLKL
jgi:hypothetical protein